MEGRTGRTEGSTEKWYIYIWQQCKIFTAD